LEERGDNDRGLVIVEEVKKEEMRRILRKWQGGEGVGVWDGCGNRGEGEMGQE
jgi:hypothetical protein